MAGPDEGNRAVRIYFAGSEGIDANAPQLIDGGASHLFVSYYHLAGPTKDRARHARVLHAYNKLGFRSIIDSGAFTFMAAARKGNNLAGDGDEAVLSHLEEYFRRYIAWVERNWSLITDFIELDMQRMVGIVPVERWRRILRDRELLSKVWMVHHSCDDWDHFVRMVEASKIENGGSGHCGIEGMNLTKPAPIDYPKHARYAYEQGVCIHAFASTRAKFLTNVPLTSSDSSTWKQASRYAVTQVYDPIHGGVVSRRYREGRDPRGKGEVTLASRAWSKALVVEGVPQEERVRAGQAFEIASIEAFLKMERELTALWEERGVCWRQVEERIANHKAGRPHG